MQPFYVFCRFFTFWGGVLWFRTRAYGQDNMPAEGGALLVSNHQSFMDPPLIASMLRRECHFMARDTLFANRAFGRLLRSLNTFAVKRGQADIGAIKETLRRLKQGHVVLMFPEGTRTSDGRIGPVRPGLHAIARKASVPIVPALIDGVYQAWPRTQRWPSFGNVIIQYGKPIWPDDFAAMTSDELIGLIRERWLEMQETLHSRLPGRRLK